MGKGKNHGTAWRIPALLLLGALMLSPLAAAPKSGSGKGGPVRGTGSETCWITPNPVPNGTQYAVNGQGFKPGQMLDVFVGDGTILFAQTVGDGTFSTWDRAAYLATGTKQAKVYQMGDRHMNVLASCSFDVY